MLEDRTEPSPPTDYFAQREAQERVNAERSADPTVKRLHLDFAARYAALIRTAV